MCTAAAYGCSPSGKKCCMSGQRCPQGLPGCPGGSKRECSSAAVQHHHVGPTATNQAALAAAVQHSNWLPQTFKPKCSSAYSTICCCLICSACCLTCLPRCVIVPHGPRLCQQQSWHALDLHSSSGAELNGAGPPHRRMLAVPIVVGHEHIGTLLLLLLQVLRPCMAVLASVGMAPGCPLTGATQVRGVLA
jgi:hypothetical protein